MKIVTIPCEGCGSGVVVEVRAGTSLRGRAGVVPWIRATTPGSFVAMVDGQDAAGDLQRVAVACCAACKDKVAA